MRSFGVYYSSIIPSRICFLNGNPAIVVSGGNVMKCEFDMRFSIPASINIGHHSSLGEILKVKYICIINFQKSCEKGKYQDGKYSNSG